MEAESLQKAFLTYIRDNRTEVTLYLANGIKLHGRIRSFDLYTLQLVQGRTAQVVYKTAISTILPVEAIQLSDPDEDRGG